MPWEKNTRWLHLKWDFGGPREKARSFCSSPATQPLRPGRGCPLAVRAEAKGTPKCGDFHLSCHLLPSKNLLSTVRQKGRAQTSAHVTAGHWQSPGCIAAGRQWALESGRALFPLPWSPSRLCLEMHVPTCMRL